MLCLTFILFLPCIRGTINIGDYAEELGQLKDIAGSLDLGNSVLDYASNYASCVAYGTSSSDCKKFTVWCTLSPIVIGKLFPGFAGDLLSDVFQPYCGNGECFQCCYVPRNGNCHTSFIGFPVLNCNPTYYGPGTRPAGMTLIVDDAQVGDACLFVGQTCCHLPICGETCPNLVYSPRAVAQRATTIATAVNENVFSYVHKEPTSEPEPDWFHGEGSQSSRSTIGLNEVTRENLTFPNRILDFVMGKGGKHWTRKLVIPWDDEVFAVNDSETGMVNQGASQLSALAKLGTLRVLASLPNVGERLNYTESHYFNSSVKESYFEQIGDDPDAELLRHMSSEALDIWKSVYQLQDYRLLAVPVTGENTSENSNIFDGFVLAQAPSLWSQVKATGSGSVELELFRTDYDSDNSSDEITPLMVDWGDGIVTRHQIGSRNSSVAVNHTYGSEGRRVLVSVMESYHGLKATNVRVVDPGKFADNLLVSTQQQPVTISAIQLNNVTVVYQQTAWDKRKVVFRLNLLSNNRSVVAVGWSPLLETNFDSRAPGRETNFGSFVVDNNARLPFSILEIVPILIFEGDLGTFGFVHISLKVEALSIAVFSTALNKYLVKMVPVTKDNIRIYLDGDNDVPLGTDQITTDIVGNLLLPIQKSSRNGLVTTSRIEVSVNSTWLQDFATLPAYEGNVPTGTSLSWKETRPRHFVVDDTTPTTTTTITTTATAHTTATSATATTTATTPTVTAATTSSITTTSSHSMQSNSAGYNVTCLSVKLCMLANFLAVLIRFLATKSTG